MLRRTCTATTPLSSRSREYPATEGSRRGVYRSRIVRFSRICFSFVYWTCCFRRSIRLGFGNGEFAMFVPECVPPVGLQSIGVVRRNCYRHAIGLDDSEVNIYSSYGATIDAQDSSSFGGLNLESRYSDFASKTNC